MGPDSGTTSASGGVRPRQWHHLRVGRLATDPTVVRLVPTYDAGRVELQEWTTQLATALGLEDVIDEGLVLDVAREAAHNVVRPAAPISAYLLGYAAAKADASPEEVERLAATIVDLATGWQARRPAADEPQDGGPPSG